jgi:hypothetical protein
MERNDRNYGDRRRRNEEHNRDQQFENYRDRYQDRGNYYGMPNEGAAYRNVRSNSESSRYGHESGGPMQSGKNEDYRTNDQYHYGDQNPYMGNRRNSDYGNRNEFDWRSERDTHHSRGNNFGKSLSEPHHYARQDNSYRSTGEGRRYNEFARDEHRTDDSHRSYNPGNSDSYYDRGKQPARREDNDYGRSRSSSESPYYDGSYDNSDFRYQGTIRSVDHQGDDRFGPSNRSEQRRGSSDGERSSSRERNTRRSGPDYGADSHISSYGKDYGL